MLRRFRDLFLWATVNSPRFFLCDVEREVCRARFDTERRRERALARRREGLRFLLPFTMWRVTRTFIGSSRVSIKQRKRADTFRCLPVSFRTC